MQKITSVLREEEINIFSILTNDSGEFGVVRLLLSDPEKALCALKNRGYLCHEDRVIGVRIADTPGSLDRLLQDISQVNINIEYLYITFDRETSAPVMVFRTASAQEVELSLQARGYETI